MNCMPYLSAGARASVPVVLDAFPDVDLAHATVGREVAETPGVESERRARSADESDHFANDDEVVSATMYGVHPAIEPAQRAGQVGGMRAAPVSVAREFFVRAARELQRQLELMVSEYVHGERRAVRERGCCAAARCQTPQQQRRLERYRGEGVGRDPDGVPVRAHCRYDRHAGGKQSEGVAQVALRECGGRSGHRMLC